MDSASRPLAAPAWSSCPSSPSPCAVSPGQSAACRGLSGPRPCVSIPCVRICVCLFILRMFAHELANWCSALLLCCVCMSTYVRMHACTCLHLPCGLLLRECCECNMVPIHVYACMLICMYQDLHVHLQKDVGACTCTYSCKYVGTYQHFYTCKMYA